MTETWELGGMRAVTFLILMIVSTVSNACTIARMIESECERDPAACVRRDLKDLYEHADVIFEVTVEKVDKPFLHGRTRAMNYVEVRHVWKSDGEPLNLVAAGWGGGDCSVALSVGATYVIFANRAESRWAFLPWVKEPLYAGIRGTFTPAEMRAQSQYHAKFYDSRSSGDLESLLKELAP